MTRTLALAALCIAVNAWAQLPELTWAQRFGSTGTDTDPNIAVDSDGHVYLTGKFSETVDFDPSDETHMLAATGLQDIFVQKLSPDGELLWAHGMGSELAEAGYSIAVDNSGNVYTLGTFALTADFDPGMGNTELTSLGDWDIFLQKLDTDGNLIWAKQWGSAGSDVGWDIAIDFSGNVICTGYFSETVDFDPGTGVFELTSLDANDAFVLKLDADGNFLWAHQAGGTGTQTGYSAATDQVGNVLVTGTFRNTVDFDPGNGTDELTSVTTSAGFVWKLDADGNHLWAIPIGSETGASPREVATDGLGNVITTGLFSNSADFDPGTGTLELTAGNQGDVFILKLTPEGTLDWAKGLGADGFDWAMGLAVDASDNIYSTGYFNGTVDFGPGPEVHMMTSAGGGDIYVLKLDSNGAWNWSYSMGSPESETGWNVTTDDQGAVYTTGRFKGTIDADPGPENYALTSSGNYDVFVQKLGQCAPDSTISAVSACGPYTWIDGITYAESTNAPMYVLTNAGGCDSVIVLDLTVHAVETGVENTGSALLAAADNAAFQWLDCTANFQAISGEMGESFTPAFTGSFAVEIEQFGCVDTSECFAFTVSNVGNVQIGNDLRAFPNPSSGSVTIDLPYFNGLAVLQVFDARGRQISRETHRTSSLRELVLPDAPGLYTLLLSTHDRRSAVRVLKE